MTIAWSKAALLLASAALLTPLAATAQVRDLDGEVSDVLTFEGAVEGAPVVYRYTMAPGTSLQVDVMPTGDSALDPTLTITDAATGEVLVEDDDGGVGLGSRGSVYSANGQQVEIAVSAYDLFSENETGGAFQLVLRPGTVAPRAIQPIAFGGKEGGELTAGGRHLYTITGEAGQLVEAALIADDDTLDPLLSIYKGSGDQGEELDSNDDGGGGLNSLLRLVLPESGTYTIATQAYGDSFGHYTLRLAEPRTHTIQSPQQVLGLGERVGGYLGTGYETGSLDPSEITYQLTPEVITAIRRGKGEVTVNLTTPLFEDEDFPSGVDPFLELGFESPLGFASMMSDDDGGEELNSRIAIDLSPLAEDGDWLERLRIRASSIGQGGAFEIELVEGMQEVSSHEWEGDEYPIPEEATE
ncbi:hypothetical protein [Alteraurantiacibacter aquimixticola]|uniref:Peptidase C-terminal archaeal/bacterial domain-containing protein n=1 Tax=Alteraurantiacibacter aquimixticola TaxID=2489173 RepID=A0A4T3F2D5_9SPHN|nr:hypothetical protein [Alteraurantiacibacter aquimixticola]TIX50455.1 hypothetical protein E5222_09275 [Alteraurantiacibacter aquimixticola]